MIDAEQIIRDFLVSSDLVAWTGARIYAGRDVPPEGYSLPTDGPCVVFKSRGGSPDYDDALLRPSLQFKCYGDSEYTAMAVYRALYDVLHNGFNENILHAEVEVTGQPLEEPDTRWRFVLCYFLAVIRQS